MSTCGSGSEKNSKAAELFHGLASNLSDDILEDCIPNLPPGQVRIILLEVAQSLDPSAKTPSPSADTRVQASDAGQDGWAGKIKGQTLSLFTDGASRGNPGNAGTGISIVDEQGDEIYSGGEYLGQCTNNEAEYRALLHGLASVRHFGCGDLAVYLDSELIVRQVLGQYKVKNANLKPLYLEVMQKLAEFTSYSIAHIRREKNSRADHLANQAIDDHLSSLKR